MEVKRYEVVIKGAIGESDKTVGEKEQEKAKERTNAEKTTDDFSKGLKRTVGAMASIYSASQLVVQPIMREKTNIAILTGDIVQAKNLQRINTNVNTIIGAGFDLMTIGVASFVNIGLGLMALGTTATKYISQEINRSQNNRMIEAQNTIDSFIKSYDRARMSTLIRG